MPDKVLAGEWWRLITFLFDSAHRRIVLFAFFFWYLFYLFGTTLEANWGTFRYNVYLLLGLRGVGRDGLRRLVRARRSLARPPTNALSLWHRVPGVRPVVSRLRDVHLLRAAGQDPLAGDLFTVDHVRRDCCSPTSWLARAMVVAAVFNYLVFFGRDIVRDMRHRHRRMQFQSRDPARRQEGSAARWPTSCHVCGLSSADAPKTQFRYCSECGGDYCYCPDHIANHEHVKPAEADQ